MPSRKGGPVLFELVRGGSHPARPVSSGGATDPEPAGGGWWNWAGRSIRVPAGYIFVVAAVIVAAGLLGYVIGFGRAERLAEADAARRAQQTMPVNDPLTEAPMNLELTAPTPEGPVDDELAAGALTGPPERGPQAQEGREAVDDGDPRDAGLNYYVIVRDLPAEGARLVEWLEARGVAAMTEPVSGGLVKVIVLQGFPRGQASSARALAFKEHLRELGRRWKRDQRGSSDFSDLYLEKHDPA
jgi:hypothetical protein